MSEEQRFIAAVKQLCDAILVCIDTQRTLPGLVLLYASIDIMASLERPASQSDTTSIEFKHWVEAYMLKGDLPNITSDDLWGARCGLLHTFAPSSKHSRTNKAREVHYSRGDKDKVMFIQNEVDPNCSSKVFVDVDLLVNAFLLATHAFLETIARNPQKKALVFEQSKKLFVHISYPKPQSSKEA